MRFVSLVTPYWTALNHLPDMFGGAPWVRWPPAARLMPRTVSPGLISARNTDWLAWEPEWVWTLAKLQLNRRLARSMAICSTTSTYQQHPNRILACVTLTLAHS